MATLLDSSVWVALYLDNDTQHDKAKHFFSRLTGRLYLTYGVVSEVATILTYKHSKAQADLFLDFVTQNSEIVWLESPTNEDVKYFQTISVRISFIDASLVRLAKALQVPLITFDKQLARLVKQTRKS